MWGGFTCVCARRAGVYLSVTKDALITCDFQLVGVKKFMPQSIRQTGAASALAPGFVKASLRERPAPPIAKRRLRHASSIQYYA